MKRWSVHCMGYASGFFEQFWLRRNAEAYFESVKDSFPVVSLEKDGKPVKSQNNKEQYPVPPMFPDEPGKRVAGYCYDARP